MVKIFRTFPHLIFFLLSVSFFSGVGQTFILSLFNQAIMEEMSVSSDYIAWHYSLATFLAGCLIAFVGNWIDRKEPFTFYLSIILALSFSFFLMSLIKIPYLLFVGYFLIRLFGQSSLPLCNNIYIAKKFGSDRGKVFGVTFFGRAICEGLMPMLIIFSLQHVSWRTVLQLLGLVILVALATQSLVLKKNDADDTDEKVTFSRGSKAHRQNYINMKSVFLVVLLLMNAALPLVLTAFYFHQSFFREMYQISSLDWGQAFLYYSFFQIIFSLLGGFVSDWLSAKRVVFLISFLGLIAFSIFSFGLPRFSIALVFSFIGMSVGWSLSSKASFMAEIFPSHQLGKIKGVDTMVMVFATSVAPSLYGMIISHATITTVKMSLIAPLLFNLIIYIFIAVAPTGLLNRLLLKQDVDW